eukprot:1168252-Pyramimonas_sp.AAC.1
MPARACASCCARRASACSALRLGVRRGRGIPRLAPTMRCAMHVGAPLCQTARLSKRKLAHQTHPRMAKLVSDHLSQRLLAPTL